MLNESAAPLNSTAINQNNVDWSSLEGRFILFVGLVALTLGILHAAKLWYRHIARRYGATSTSAADEVADQASAITWFAAFIGLVLIIAWKEPASIAAIAITGTLAAIGITRIIHLSTTVPRAALEQQGLMGSKPTQPDLSKNDPLWHELDQSGIEEDLP